MSYETHETTLINVTDVKIDESNPNSMSKEMTNRLQKSLETYGVTQDIIVCKDTMLIADGEHRYKQLIQNGAQKIPVKLVKFKSEAHRRAYRQAANKIRGEHDPAKDAQEYHHLLQAQDPILMRLATGMSMSEVKEHLRRLSIITKEEKETPPLEEVKTNITNGEVFSLGAHTIVCGDCTQKEAYTHIQKTADLLLTDPPYGVNYSSKNNYLNEWDKGNRNKTPIEKDDYVPEEIGKLWFKSFQQAKKHLSQEASHYIFGPQGGDIHLMMMMMMQKAELMLHHVLIWVKNNHVLGRTDYNYQHEPILYGWNKKHKFYGKGEQTKSVWNYDKPTQSKHHPTMKPVELLINAILNSTKEQDLVLDPFGGSGSTLIACEKTGRKCYMIEISPIYCQVIINRWQDLTGQQAVRISTHGE